MKTVVIIPTYNESENIVPLARSIAALGIGCDILVVDDSSPDGTSEIVARLAEEDPRVHLFRRAEKKGRGYAGIAGFKQALSMGADLIVEMDADFSHHPRFIPGLADACRGADIAIGSRGVAGGGEQGRGCFRRLLTKLANLYIRILLGEPIRDCTSGFRCFRRVVLENIDLDTMVSSGPSVVEEVLFRAKRRGFTFCEVPITFEQRQRGTSQLSLSKLLNTFWMVLRFWAGTNENL
ncbi:MAG TPA: polyprenol monophosphomannose synthase [bacterium]|nr:polyprenol monophosphomannose synthase [bacterium]